MDQSIPRQTKKYRKMQINTLGRQEGAQSQIKEIKITTRKYCDQFYAHTFEHA